MLKNNNNIKLKNKSEGITLVALVVTIVILLILAGITINMLFSDNGIIKQAQEAANKTNEVNQKEEEGMQNLEDVLNYYANGGTVTPIVKDINTITEIQTKNIQAKDKQGNIVTVPKGFKVVVSEGTMVQNGLVIEDEEGNQFVWVPVPDVTTMYEIQNGEKVGKLYDFSITGYTPRTYLGKNEDFREPDIVTKSSTGDGTNYDGDTTYLTILGLSSSSEFATQLQNEFNDMIASVEKYKGFYIGRYETGNLAANTTTVPVVKKGQTEINNVNWYYIYQNSKKISGSNNAIKTSMIWGSQWDRTLQWLVESGSKTYAELQDSKTWGNYIDSTGVAITNSGSVQPTGNNEAWKANNIYDMAGNIWDWTIEAYNIGSRVYRRRKL